MQFLAGQFGIDVLGFAVMSNHIHVVLRNRRRRPGLVGSRSGPQVVEPLSETARP